MGAAVDASECTCYTKMEVIMTKDEALEELAQCVDTVDNLVSAMAISVPAEIHLSALKESLPDLKGRIKQVYFELGGNDVWLV